jgi:hypothetical protein
MLATSCYWVSVNADAPREPSTRFGPPSRKQHPAFARFRAWRERTLPHASYQIAPACWTPAGLQYAATVDPIVVPSVKRREPTITGMAHTARAVYLVGCTRDAGYEQIAKLIHCRALMRDDPDYAEHRGKRVFMLLLCDDCSPAVADFASRQRVRVLTTPISSGVGDASMCPSAEA